MEGASLIDKEWCGSVYANPPSDRVKPLTDDREISKEELALVCSTLPAGPSKPVLVEHDVSKQVGVITAMYQVPDSGTTYARFRLYDNDEGRKTKQAIEAGKLRGLSLGTDWERRPGLPTRLVRLRELSVCTEGARPDTGIVNASKEAQQADFVPLAPKMNPTHPPTPSPAPISDAQVSGSVNASAQPVPMQQPVQQQQQPQYQQQQQPQQQFGGMPNMPYQTHMPAHMATPPTTMPWGQFANDPTAHFKGLLPQPHQQYPAPFLHHMPLPPGLQPPTPMQPPQQQQQQQVPPQYQQYYGQYGVMPPPYLLPQQPQPPYTPTPPQQQPPQQQQQQQQTPPPPPGVSRKNKRTVTQAAVDEDESSANSEDSGDNKSEDAATTSDEDTKSRSNKRHESQKADKIQPIPETKDQLDRVIESIMATQGMSNQAKADNIRALTATHRQLKEMHEQNCKTAEQALQTLEARLKAAGLATNSNNALLKRFHNEIRDPAKFRTVMEEMQSMMSMLGGNDSSSSSPSSSSSSSSSGQSGGGQLDINALSQPADGLSAALQEWRSLHGGHHPTQTSPATMGSVNASKSAQQPDFPLPRHTGNPHGLKLTNGQPYVPMYGLAGSGNSEPPLFNQRIKVVDTTWGTIKFE